jgi:hypothetical protein
MSNDTVTEFPGVTKHATPVARVMALAAGAKLTSAVVIGWDQDGDLYFRSSESRGPDVLWLLEQAKRELLVARDE